MYTYLPFMTGVLNAPLASDSTVAVVPASFAQYLLATVDFAGGDYTFITIYENASVEQVRITEATINGLNGLIVIERAQGINGVARNFTLAAQFQSGASEAGLLDALLTSVAQPNITGTGAASVNGVDPIVINVPKLVFTGGRGIEITGTWPNQTVSMTVAASCCGSDETDEGGTPADLELQTEGIISGYFSGATLSLTVEAPNFSSNSLNITGSWPDFQFEVDGGTGGGEVTAGAGLSQTGVPGGDTTLFITNTGVTAADYGGFIVNARGQITALPADFNPLSDLVPGDGIEISRVGGTATIAAVAGAVGVIGGVALADGDEALDPLDETTAVTPKLLASVIADLETGEILGGQIYSGEADADYTYTIPLTPVTLVLEAGEKAVIIANATIRDNAAPTTAQNWGLALFAVSANTRIHADRKAPQNNQSMTCVIDGPFNDAIVMRSTALPGAAVANSYALTIVKV